MNVVLNTIDQELLKKFGNNQPKLPQSVYPILGIGKKTFRKYLKNELQPRLDELKRIADWLGVDPKDLF